MAPEPYKEPSKFVLALKWGGCLTASVFAVGGLLLNVASLDQTYETLSRTSWVIATLAMAVGFIGAVLDRSSELPKSSGLNTNGDGENVVKPPSDFHRSMISGRTEDLPLH